MRGTKPMEAEPVEFEDWEVLPKSDDIALFADSSSTSVSVVLDYAPTNFDMAEPEGTIRSDYFYLDNRCRHAKAVAQGDESGEGCVDSDNSSWIDPGVEEHCFDSKKSAQLWSDSGSDRSEEHKFGESDASKALGLGEIVKSHVGLGKMESGNRISGEFSSDSESKVSDSNLIHESGFVERSKSVLGFEDHSEIGRWDKKPERKLSDGEVADGDDTETLGVSNDLDGGSQVQGVGDCAEEQHLAVADVKHDVKSRGEGEKMRIVWWKVSFEVFKNCVYRVSPLWSFSVAAAFVGFVFLGRRLYKMKRKSPGVQLKVAMDDTKVSQFISGASRLNEAFSVARRVPITQPLPLAGISPWPMMSLR